MSGFTSMKYDSQSTYIYPSAVNSKALQGTRDKYMYLGYLIT